LGLPFESNYSIKNPTKEYFSQAIMRGSFWLFCLLEEQLAPDVFHPVERSDRFFVIPKICTPQLLTNNSKLGVSLENERNFLINSFEKRVVLLVIKEIFFEGVIYSFSPCDRN